HVVSRGKLPRNLAPPALLSAGGAPPPSGDGAGHTAPRKQPLGEARLSGRQTPAKDTQLLCAGAFSGTVSRGDFRLPLRDGAAVRYGEMVGCQSTSVHLYSGEPSMNIFVGNLAFTTTEQDLRQLFEPYGTVETIRIMTDRETGRSRGF